MSYCPTCFRNKEEGHQTWCPENPETNLFQGNTDVDELAEMLGIKK
jgi:hypothetical protein